jgi:PAS domain-containing protein
MSPTWLINNAPLIIGIAMMLLALAAALVFAARQDRQLRQQDLAIAHYRALFDSLGDGIAYFDGAGRLALWDEGFEDVIRQCGVEVRRGETAFELADRIPGVQLGFDREEEFERVRMGQRVEREFHLPDGPTFHSTTWQAGGGGFAMSVHEVKLGAPPRTG